MNDFSELESELRKLRPVAASAELISKIECVLAQPPVPTRASGVLTRPKPFRINWLSLGLGLAAASAFLLLAKVGDNPAAKNRKILSAGKPAPSRGVAAGGENFIPTGVTQLVYDARDEGLVFATGVENPVRRMRYRTQESLQWRQPATGASLRVTYPSEEVVMMPVSGQ